MRDSEGGVALLPEALNVDQAAVEKACKAAQALLRRAEPAAPRHIRRRVSQPSAQAPVVDDASAADSVH